MVLHKSTVHLYAVNHQVRQTNQCGTMRQVEPAKPLLDSHMINKFICAKTQNPNRTRKKSEDKRQKRLRFDENFVQVLRCRFQLGDDRSASHNENRMGFQLCPLVDEKQNFLG